MRVNKEFGQINLSFKNNKFLLNYCQSKFLLMNKQRNSTIKNIFKNISNNKVIEQTSFIKYLELQVIVKLNRSEHIKQLLLQMSKHPRIIYRSRNFVTMKILNVYYSIIHIRIPFGIMVWGTRANYKIQAIEVRLNNVI